MNGLAVAHQKIPRHTTRYKEKSPNGKMALLGSRMYVKIFKMPRESSRFSEFHILFITLCLWKSYNLFINSPKAFSEF